MIAGGFARCTFRIDGLCRAQRAQKCAGQAGLERRGGGRAELAAPSFYRVPLWRVGGWGGVCKRGGQKRRKPGLCVAHQPKTGAAPARRAVESSREVVFHLRHHARCFTYLRSATSPTCSHGQLSRGRHSCVKEGAHPLQTLESLGALPGRHGRRHLLQVISSERSPLIPPASCASAG